MTFRRPRLRFKTAAAVVLSLATVVAASMSVPPVGTDCAATGAVCADVGRKLSNGLKFTVTGSGS